MDSVRALDISLFHLLNGLLGKSATLDFIIFFTAKYAVAIVIVLALTSLFVDYGREPERRFTLNALGLIFSVGAVLSLTKWIRLLYHHDRPLFALGSPYLLFEDSYSFPSGHTIFIIGIATAVYFYNRTLSYILFALGILVGISRIAVGVHYPSDILGGILLGVAAGVLVEYSIRTFSKYVRRHQKKTRRK